MSAKKTGEVIKCAVCGKEKYFPQCRLDQQAKYCSNKCYFIASKGTPKPSLQNGKIVKCTECGKEFYLSNSQFHIKRCSKKCANAYMSRLYKNRPDRKANLRRAMTFRDFTTPEAHERMVKIGSMTKPRFGAANNLWKGGITTLQNKQRAKPEYKAWRKAVYERDGYKCQMCGTNKNLHAHHKKEFAKYPELRYEVSNGLTVCQPCHGKIHGRNIPNIGQVNKKLNK